MNIATSQPSLRAGETTNRNTRSGHHITKKTNLPVTYTHELTVGALSLASRRRTSSCSRLSPDRLRFLATHDTGADGLGAAQARPRQLRRYPPGTESEDQDRRGRPSLAVDQGLRRLRPLS